MKYIQIILVLTISIFIQDLATAQWSTNTTPNPDFVYVTNLNNQVGIGINTPTSAKLTVWDFNDRLIDLVGDGGANYGIDVNAFGQLAFLRNSNANDDILVLDDDSGDIWHNVPGFGGYNLVGDDSGDLRLTFKNGLHTHYIFDDDSDGHSLDIQTATEMNFMVGATEYITLTNLGTTRFHNDNAAIELTGSNSWISFRNGQVGVYKGYLQHDDNDMYLVNSASAGSLNFGTKNLTRVVIDSIGNVGIGTLNPEHPLHAYTGNGQIRFKKDAAFIDCQAGGDNDPRGMHFYDKFGTLTGSIYMNGLDNIVLRNQSQEDFVVDPMGNVGIGTSTPACELEVVGDVCISGELTAASDGRLKENIQPLHSALPIIRRLNPVSYDFKTTEYPNLNLSDKNKIGLLAQEVEEILPTLVKEGAQVTAGNGEKYNLKSINYIELIPVLIKSIQELEQEVDESRQLIRTQSTEINKLKNALINNK